MKPKALAPAFAALFGGGMVALLGSAAVNHEHGRRVAEARIAVGEQLDAVAARLAEEVGDAYRRLLAATPPGAEVSLREAAAAASSERYSAWWFDGRSLSVIGNQQIGFFRAATALIEHDQATLVGPVTSLQGTDAFLLQAPPRAEIGTKIGLVIPIDGLWRAAGVFDLMGHGLELTVRDGEGRVIYWTSAAPLDAPVSRDFGIADQRWTFAVAPRSGWVNAKIIAPGAVLTLVLAVAYALASYTLAARPADLRRSIAELKARLLVKDSELSILLNSRSQLETQLANSLTTDVNTGLPNRTSFVEHVQHALSERRRLSSGSVAVAVARFPKLEALNHSMGAAVAEDVIAAAAETLTPVVAGSGFLARIGDRELAVCVTGDVAPKDIAESLAAGSSERLVVAGRAVYSPVVFGIATSADGYDHGPELIAKASMAAGEAGERGERWSTFDPETKEARISLLQLEADLQRAIDRSELRLHFQPIVSIADGRVVGLESLLRWRHPTAQWVGPERFIPLAESMGQMPRISEWVLRQAVAHAAQWQRLRAEPIYITVNLTPRDLNREMCNYLFELLRASSLAPETIRIEVTETAVVRDFRVAARLLGELNERGLRVVLDDFGTGYSSLSYLRDLPFHAVKIDKSFIQKISTEAKDFGLVRSIVGLVHYLGMECVAEGIETQEQLDLVGMMNCDYGQGFLFSRPLPPGEVEELVRAGGVKQRVGRQTAT
jgi:EAL domain-containing protein (putative c-di-GMP-specific phosphodiesterase class I)/GGDEF domain-containing protein